MEDKIENIICNIDNITNELQKIQPNNQVYEGLINVNNFINIDDSNFPKSKPFEKIIGSIKL